MKAAELPADVRRFILTSVPSVPYLEAVLLLRAEPDTAWDAPRLARRLYVPERQAAELLQALRTSAIAQPAPGSDAGVRYRPETPELAELLEGVARAYAVNLMGVTDLIHSRVDKRAQQFADAFRWRKDT